MSDYSNYSGDVLAKSIERLESLGRPLPGPLNNMLTQLRRALTIRNADDMKQLTQCELRTAIDALLAIKKQHTANEISNRVLGRVN